ncbi:MAG: rhodanese-like domain-containing protein [Candidatus Andersenbacteria bacterium]
MADVKTLSTQELKQWIDEGQQFVLLDVLMPASYEARHIPTAKSASVNEPDFMENAQGVIPNKEIAVVAYCSSAQCGASPRAAAQLIEAGYTNVYHYKEGLAGWQDAGYSFEGDAA